MKECLASFEACDYRAGVAHVSMDKPKVDLLASADALIGDESHHTGRHVIEMVAMKGPPSGVTRVKRQGHARHLRE